MGIVINNDNEKPGCPAINKLIRLTSIMKLSTNTLKGFMASKNKNDDTKNIKYDVRSAPTSEIHHCVKDE